MRRSHVIAASGASLFITCASVADIARGEFPPQITDIYNDLDEWLAVAPEVTTIDFIGLLDGEHIDDEFADLGVQFTGGFYTAIDNTGLDNDTFVDDFGLDGNSTTIVMEFDQPFNVFGVLFPGRMQLMFYLDDVLVGWTSNQGASVPGNFAGVLTDIMFDEVHAFDSADQVFIDNIYFSFIEVPAPGAALPLMGFGVFARSRSRRRSRRD